MMYHGTFTSEEIVFYSLEHPNEAHWITLTKSADEPTFSVTCCCDPDWYYEFYMENNSTYERVKLAVMDTLCDCHNADELMDELSDIFEDGFEDILVEDVCDCACDHCECSKYLN